VVVQQAQQRLYPLAIDPDEGHRLRELVKKRPGVAVLRRIRPRQWNHDPLQVPRSGQLGDDPPHGRLLELRVKRRQHQRDGRRFGENLKFSLQPLKSIVMKAMESRDGSGLIEIGHASLPSLSA